MKAELLMRLMKLLKHVSDEEKNANRKLAKITERMRLAIAYLEALSKPVSVSSAQF